METSTGNQCLERRSYIAKMENGSLYRRSRTHLMKKNEGSYDNIIIESDDDEVDGLDLSNTIN